jgi:hypothetical protein
MRKVNVSLQQMSDAELLAIVAKAHTAALIEAKPTVAAMSAPDDVVIKRDQAAINAGLDFRR